MNILGHTGGGYGGNAVLSPWEIHPILTHFPIAFLLGAVALSLYAGWRGRVGLEQVATGLLIGGLVTGLFTALAGFLAFFTLPETHTEEVHHLMYWHLGLQAAALALFTWAAWLRWRGWALPPDLGTRVIGWAATVVLVLGSAVGGYIVYHGGAGIDARLMKPGLHEGDHHGGGQEGDRGRSQNQPGQGHSPGHSQHEH